MDGTWMLMRGFGRGAETPKSVRPGTLRRIIAFARPHHATLTVFLLLTVISAVLAVSTPVLAGRVVDAIVSHRGAGLVVALAVLIAVLALLDAAVGLVERLLSSRIGEGLIFDLRRAVFEHVQRMPVAFFTRTRTGALVSRLNNDVIGAQRAFTSTLSGMVTNVRQHQEVLASRAALRANARAVACFAALSAAAASRSACAACAACQLNAFRRRRSDKK